MADPLSLAATITTLVVKAFTISRDIQSKVDEITNAPKHIQALANDLEDFFFILGSLKGYLEDPEMSIGVLEVAETVNISKVLENCLLIFTRINLLVNSYNARGRRGGIGDMGNWRKIKYSFKIAETDALRSEMATHKMTLNMAISLVDFINLNTTNVTAQNIEAEISNHMRELEEKLPIISHQLEDFRAATLPPGKNPSLSDRERLISDYDFTVRRYLDCGASMISDCATPDNSSMQISSLGTFEISAGSTHISIYETAKTHLSEAQNLGIVIEEDEDYEDDCSQIFVKGPLDKTSVLQVDSGMTLYDITKTLQGRDALYLPCDTFDSPQSLPMIFYTFSGHVLSENLTLRGCRIPNNGTIFCHLRVGTPNWVYIKALSGKTFRIDIEQDLLVQDLKRRIQYKEGIPPENQWLLCRDHKLERGKTLEDYEIKGGDEILLLFCLNPELYEVSQPDTDAWTATFSMKRRMGIFGPKRPKRDSRHFDRFYR